MAERLESYEFSRRGRYPWGEWMDGSIWRCKRGEDFSATAKSFQGMVRLKAARNGKKVITRVEGDSVVFQFSNN